MANGSSTNAWRTRRACSANCATSWRPPMEYSLLKFFHILGAVIIGGGLIGVWMADLRSRQLRELKSFSEAVRNIAVFYDGLVVPGALLLLISGTWMIVKFYGGGGWCARRRLLLYG